MFFLGCIAFALFFLSDYNDAKCRLRGLVFCFPIGFVLLVLAIVFQLDGEPPLLTMPWRIAVTGMFACFLGLLVYTLFFAFPAASAYGSPGQKRPVCDRGVYALCRHPGVLWLGFALICLWLGGGLPLYAAITYSLLDLALVAFEDIYVFPRIISGYDRYRNATPFLIPTVNSIKTALGKKRTESVTGR